MFYNYNGTLQINCQVIPNTDVSGVGVRWALFLQAFTAIVLSALALGPSEILMTNISTQGTSLALIAATYFDPTVDVVHAIVASQFAVLLSSCRITTFDIPTSFPRIRCSMKLISRLQVWDFVCRTSLLYFNTRIWFNVLKMQANKLCPTSAGTWSLLWQKFDLTDQSGASSFAFAYCIIDIAWEALRYSSVIVEKCRLDHSRAISSKSWDPRIRVITALAGPCKILKTRLELSRIVRPISVFYKSCTLVCVTVNILQSVHDNDLTGENYWTFGQIFTMASMVGTIAALVSHFMPSTILGSSRFVVRYMAETDVRPVLIVVAFMCALTPGGLLLFDDRMGLWSPVRILEVSFGVLLSTVFYYFLLLPVWLIPRASIRGRLAPIRERLAPVIDRLAPVIVFLSPTIRWVARRTDTVWAAIEQYFLWIVSSDGLSKTIEIEEQKALELCTEPHNSERYWIERKAYAYEKSGDLSSAMDAWVQISGMSTGDWWPHYQIASLCEQLGEFERAITIWEKLVAQNFSQQGLHNLMVKRLERAYSIGRGPVAEIGAWGALILANPSNSSVVNSAAKILHGQAAYSTLIEVFGTLNTDDQEVKLLLAKVYESRKDYATALKLRREIWDQFKDKAALVETYVNFLADSHGCERCLEARRVLDPQYKCTTCDQYIGGLDVNANITYGIRRRVE